MFVDFIFQIWIRVSFLSYNSDIMNTNIIETNALSFSYKKGSKIILDNLSLQVPKGAIYGFLGANGAGKSTTMQLLTGIIEDSSQSISTFNKPLHTQLPRLFEKVGCLIESPSLYHHLTGYNNLLYISKMKSLEIEQIDKILDLVQLTEAKNQKVKSYSLGMKQRLAIAIALLGNPELLLLDEPINGLDPQGIIDVRELLIKLNKEYGITIFISSHLLDEIERICTHIGVLNNGKLVFQDRIEVLKEKTKFNKNIYLRIENSDEWFPIIKEKYKNSTINNGVICLENTNQSELNKLLIDLLQQGVIIKELNTNEGLESLFLQLTK